MRRKLSRPVDIIGVGIKHQGFVAEDDKLKGMTSRELWSWADQEAMQDEGVSAKDVEGCLWATEQVKNGMKVKMVTRNLRRESKTGIGRTDLWISPER